MSASVRPAPDVRQSTNRLLLLDGNAERKRLIAAHPEAVLVSARLPLRANLTVLENIAVVPQFRQGMRAAEAERYALDLLEQVGCASCAHRRDPDLDHEQRFIAKLLRAIVLEPTIILIDRPGRLLPDTYYPRFLKKTLAALNGRYEQCWIVDYKWNAPLYLPPGSGTSV